YDITDFYTVDDRLGSLGDFTEMVHQATDRGLRVMIDLVINHTSDEHPWFQSARSDPKSPYRDWYIWSEQKPSDLHQGMVFPGVQDATWTYDRTAKAWYYHRFYDFQPDLNMENPAVREEIHKIVGFWLQMGVSGFRVDAAPFVVELTRPGEPEPRKDLSWLSDLHDRLSWRRGDAVFLAEANVERDELIDYFGDGQRLVMMFNFLLNQRTFLALARGEAAPIVQGLAESPTLAPNCQFATFLRNHDEIDLGRLGDRERQEVFEAFGPEPGMQLYDRGIRRRLAPMLDGDRRRLEMAYALQLALPGTPVIRYGDEIGMGEDLSLPERNAIRTPMQWGDKPNGGFSDAPKSRLRRPVISGGPFGYETVNVTEQRHSPESLLAWFEQTLHTLRECPEFAVGACTPIDVGERGVLGLLYDAPGGTMLALTNLNDTSCTIDVGPQESQEGDPEEMHANRDYPPAKPDLTGLELDGYGYRWIRLRRTVGR
ncbi:MAG: maltose alpha-D-glucosyltransferase / alpha-amylase, partial [Nocardioidaceae bacterium]|nr:maltose alpha-D-glucosyltransferase / alpha-amylase [Nocardioidaceae bacterium]